MSDKLEWMNKHLVLLRHLTWQDAVNIEQYKIRPDLMPVFEISPQSEDVLREFGAQKKFKEGCDFLAYVIHRRVAVWWGYCALLTLLEELKECPKKELIPADYLPLLEDIKKIPGIKKLPMPTMDLPEESIELDYDKLLNFEPFPTPDRSKVEAATAALKGKTAQLKQAIPDWINKFYEGKKGELAAAYAKQHGFTQEEYFQKALAAAKDSLVTYKVERVNSPQIQKIIGVGDLNRKYINKAIADIKSSFPEKYPPTPEAAKLFELDKKKKQDCALDAIYRWIVAPDEGNSQRALDAGNSCGADKPEGLLSLCAFWSFGSLTPGGEQVIPTPPGLAATGIMSSFLTMALTQNGTRTKDERYELYFNMGMEIACGKNLWDKSVEEELMPHKQEKPLNLSTQIEETSTYSKWKMDRP